MTTIIYDKDYMDMDLGMAYRFLDTKTVLTEFHKHNYYEYFIVTSGTMIHEVNGVKSHLKTGDMVFMRPNDYHCHYSDEQQSYKLINVSFRTCHFDKVMDYFQSNILEQMMLANDPPKISLPAPQLTALKKKHYQLNVCTQKENLIVQLKALLIDVFAYFIENYEEQSKYDSSKWLQIMLAQMNTPENIEEGLPALIRYSGFSHGHLCRIMRQEMNTTPTKYITDLRLKYAANLLATSDYDILSISVRLGFSSLSHFTTIFKAKFGLSPSKYRAQNNKQAWI